MHGRWFRSDCIEPMCRYETTGNVRISGVEIRWRAPVTCGLICRCGRDVKCATPARPLLRRSKPTRDFSFAMIARRSWTSRSRNLNFRPARRAPIERGHCCTVFPRTTGKDRVMAKRNGPSAGEAGTDRLGAFIICRGGPARFSERASPRTVPGKLTVCSHILASEYTH
jgi:hypothetical protein